MNPPNVWATIKQVAEDRRREERAWSCSPLSHRTRTNCLGVHSECVEVSVYHHSSCFQLSLSSARFYSSSFLSTLFFFWLWPVDVRKRRWGEETCAKVPSWEPKHALKCPSFLHSPSKSQCTPLLWLLLMHLFIWHWGINTSPSPNTKSQPGVKTKPTRFVICFAYLTLCETLRSSSRRAFIYPTSRLWLEV